MDKELTFTNRTALKNSIPFKDEVNELGLLCQPYDYEEAEPIFQNYDCDVFRPTSTFGLEKPGFKYDKSIKDGVKVFIPTDYLEKARMGYIEPKHFFLIVMLLIPHISILSAGNIANVLKLVKGFSTQKLIEDKLTVLKKKGIISRPKRRTDGRKTSIYLKGQLNMKRFYLPADYLVKVMAGVINCNHFLLICYLKYTKYISPIFMPFPSVVADNFSKVSGMCTTEEISHLYSELKQLNIISTYYDKGLTEKSTNKYYDKKNNKYYVYFKPVAQHSKMGFNLLTMAFNGNKFNPQNP